MAESVWRSGSVVPSMLVAVVAVGVALVGCAPLKIAHDVDRSSLHGEWSVTYDGGEARLTLVKDGTFSAEGWPRDLICQPSRAESMDQLDWHDPVSFGGTWSSVSDELVYAVDFSFEDPSCSGTGWNSYVWSDGSGELLIKVFLDSVWDADTASGDQVVWLRKGD